MHKCGRFSLGLGAELFCESCSQLLEGRRQWVNTLHTLATPLGSKFPLCLGTTRCQDGPAGPRGGTCRTSGGGALSLSNTPPAIGSKGRLLPPLQPDRLGILDTGGPRKACRRLQGLPSCILVCSPWFPMFGGAGTLQFRRPQSLISLSVRTERLSVSLWGHKNWDGVPRKFPGSPRRLTQALKQIHIRLSFACAYGVMQGPRQGKIIT